MFDCRIRVLHVITDLNVGGAELMLKRLILTGSEDSRTEHIVVSLTTIGAVGTTLRKSNVQVVELGLASIVGLPVAFYKLYKHIKVMRPDIVQTWMYHADLIGGIAARLAGAKNILWGIRATDLPKKGSSTAIFVRAICAKLSYSVPRYIVCAAEASRQSHIALNYDKRKMMVIANGFDANAGVKAIGQREKVRSQYGFAKNQLVIGHVGRFNFDKDQENFVAAVGQLAEIYEHVRFLMIGRDIGQENRTLWKWIVETGWQDRFTLLGERDDVSSCLAAMDIFCLSSRAEGFPNVVGEAMMTGVPCVVTDVGDAAMLVGDAGLVVRKENAQLLANGLSRLIEMSDSERKRLGECGRRRVAEKYSMATVYEHFQGLYGEVMKESGS